MAKAINNRNSGYPSQKKASTAYQVGDILTVDSNGFLVPGGAGIPVGICNEEITSASADYASTRDLVYSGYKMDDYFEFPVITGTATQTLVDELVDIDATDFRGLDVTASTNNQVRVTRILSTTLVEGQFVPKVA